LSCLVLSCLIVHLVLSDHFSPLFPLLKIVSRFPASRPTWSGAYDTRRASSLSSSTSSIVMVMVSSTTLFIVLFALALAWAWRLLWSLVMAGHGRSWQPLGFITIVSLSPLLSWGMVVYDQKHLYPSPRATGGPAGSRRWSYFPGICWQACHVRAFPSLLLFSATKSKHRHGQ
jgi:hypothetical protein